MMPGKRAHEFSVSSTEKPDPERSKTLKSCFLPVIGCVKRMMGAGVISSRMLLNLFLLNRCILLFVGLSRKSRVLPFDVS